MPKNLYLRDGIYWARFKVRGVEYRESLRTRAERVAVKRLTEVSSRMGDLTRRVARKAARESVEFHRFSHHDFRHLFAVEYLRSGRGSIYDLQGELGHSTITVTERYLAFLTPEQVKAAKSTVAQKTAHPPRSEGAATG